MYFLGNVEEVTRLGEKVGAKREPLVGVGRIVQEADDRERVRPRRLQGHELWSRADSLRPRTNSRSRSRTLELNEIQALRHTSRPVKVKVKI
jgi:hypothetical protein